MNTHSIEKTLNIPGPTWSEMLNKQMEEKKILFTGLQEIRSIGYRTGRMDIAEKVNQILDQYFSHEY